MRGRGAEFEVYNTHLAVVRPRNALKRLADQRRQLDAILARLRSAGRPYVLGGDFNFPPDNSARQEMQSPLARGGPALRDAWEQLYPGKPHPPTFCVHDRSFSKAPYCCDFVFASEDLCRWLRSVSVDVAAQDSDHQPVLVEIED